MLWTWRTTATGVVEVDTTGSGVLSALSLPGPDAGTTRTASWLSLATTSGARYGVPVSWILAVIYAESMGNPRATNACCDGLMQLSRDTWHIPQATLFDPTFNVDFGTKVLGKYRAQGFDLPRVASMYNAGPGAHGPKTSSRSVWGFVEDAPASPWTGYIEKVVRANNWWITQGLTGSADPAQPGTLLLPDEGSGASVALGLLTLGLAGVLGYGAVKLWFSRPVVLG